MEQKFVRRLRLVAMIGSLPFILAARNTVTPLPQTMIADDTDRQVGATFVARKDDVILRAKIYDTEVVRLQAPVSVSIAKFSETIGTDTKLEPVLAPEKTEELTGASGRFYCGQNQRTRSGFTEAMIGDWFSKYETQVRFCFVDSDDDGKLDKVFLAGAKDKADQGARPIEPVAYTSKMLELDEQNRVVEVKLRKIDTKSSKVHLRVSISRGEVEEYFTYILTLPNGQTRHTYPDLKTNPKKVPYPVYFNDIFGAEIGIMSVDPLKEQAEIKILRKIRPQMFKPISVQVQTIYIYY